MPMNTLVIYSVAGKKETIDSLKTFKLADEADWIAYQRGRKDSTLYVRSLDGSKTFQFPTVTDFQFAKKSGMLYYTSAAEGEAGIFTLNPEKGSPALIKEGKGVFKRERGTASFLILRRQRFFLQSVKLMAIRT